MTAFVNSSVQPRFADTGRVVLSGAGAAGCDATALVAGEAGARARFEYPVPEVEHSGAGRAEQHEQAQ